MSWVTSWLTKLRRRLKKRAEKKLRDFLRAKILDIPSDVTIAEASRWLSDSVSAKVPLILWRLVYLEMEQLSQLHGLTGDHFKSRFLQWNERWRL